MPETVTLPTTLCDPFEDILVEIAQLHARKQEDYGAPTDPYANVRASEKFGVPAWVGALIRQQDKMKRVEAFLRNGRLRNESLEDSLLDNAVYAIIALLLHRETAQDVEASRQQ